jgi:hypothetical protein
VPVLLVLQRLVHQHYPLLGSVLLFLPDASPSLLVGV